MAGDEMAVLYLLSRQSFDNRNDKNKAGGSKHFPRIDDNANASRSDWYMRSGEKILNKALKHSMTSYVKIFLIGIAAGCVCRLADFFPADTLWSFSSIQTLFGFWIITNTIIVLASTSNICAGISSFLYMFGMTLSFYGLQAILGLFIPMFSGEFRTSLFVLYTILSIPCAIAAFILYFWNREHVLNSVLYALPIGALAAETFAIFLYFLENHTFLFQLLMDGAGVIVFLLMFFKKAKSKWLYITASVVSTFLFYIIFPW